MLFIIGEERSFLYGFTLFTFYLFIYFIFACADVLIDFDSPCAKVIMVFIDFESRPFRSIKIG